jgi:hypothetical protein
MNVILLLISKNHTIFKYATLIFLLFISINAYSQQLSDTTFYPLQVGNEWEYSYDPPSETEPPLDTLRITKDTIMPNHKKYYCFEPKKFWYNTIIKKTFGGFDYIRMDSLGNIYHYDQFNFDDDTATTELVSENFSLPVGSYFKSYYGIYRNVDSAKMDGKGEGSSNYINGINSFIAFRYKIPGDEDYYYVFEKGIGIIRYRWGAYIPIILKSAIINGKKYVNKSLVRIKENQNNVIPTFDLKQNYPNPFNNSTSIGYSISQKSFVEIIVYDLLGRKVRTLVSCIKEPGSYVCEFNALNLPSGMYICKLNYNNQLKTIKLQLLK